MRRSTAVGLAALMAVGLLVAREPPAARGADLPAPPIVEVDPYCNGGSTEGSFDVSFTFRLRNFTPNVEVTVQFGQGEPPQQQPISTGAYGSADQQLTFVIGGLAPIPIQAFETNNPAISATTSLQIPCLPQISINPRCDTPADPAAPRPLAITVDGFNWGGGPNPVDVVLMQRVGGNEVQVSNAVNATLGGATSFQAVINAAFSGSDDVASPLMALPAGDYFVRAAERVFEGPAGFVVEVDFAVPCPQVSVNPTCGDRGGPFDLYDIGISGSGWRPGVRAEVTFEAQNPQVFLLDVGASGQLLVRDVEEARIRPFRRPDGQYVVTVRQRAAPAGVLREAAAAFIVPCPATPQIRIEPVCGPPQILGDDPRTTTLRVIGSALPSALLTITIQPAPGGTADTRQFGVAGNIDEPFDIPRRPLGSYAIDMTLVDAAGIPVMSVPQSIFTVPCEPPQPRIRLRCDPEETNLPDLAEVVLEARGFYPDAPIELVLGGAAESVRTDVNGEFTRRTPSLSFAAGALEARMTQLDANQQIAAEATRSLALPCGTRVPTLVISPPAAAPGQVVLVTGLNMRPNVNLSLRWSRGIGSSQTINVTTDADGLFEKQVLLFHHDFTGARDLTVEASDDPLAIGTTVMFFVAAGRGTPPAFSDAAPVGFPPIVFRR